MQFEVKSCDLSRRNADEMLRRLATCQQWTSWAYHARVRVTWDDHSLIQVWTDTATRIDAVQNLGHEAQNLNSSLYRDILRKIHDHMYKCRYECDSFSPRASRCMADHMRPTHAVQLFFVDKTRNPLRSLRFLFLDVFILQKPLTRSVFCSDLGVFCSDLVICPKRFLLSRCYFGWSHCCHVTKNATTLGQVPFVWPADIKETPEHALAFISSRPVRSAIYSPTQVPPQSSY